MFYFHRMHEGKKLSGFRITFIFFFNCLPSLGRICTSLDGSCDISVMVATAAIIQIFCSASDSAQGKSDPRGYTATQSILQAAEEGLPSPHLSSLLFSPVPPESLGQMRPFTSGALDTVRETSIPHV